jgi:PAS domain S-box-containing protein
MSERSERRFRKLIANISDTITLVDAEGRVMMVTGAAHEILGFPGDYWSGQNVFDIVHPDDRDRIEAFHQAALERPGGEVSAQLRALHADGSWVDLEITVVNLLDDADVGGGVITSRNISSHKAIERALSDAHRQALDALAAKAEFVAQVGHEVRTPIHGIIGMAELLAEADLDPDSRRLVESIRRAGESLGLVIDDLLDFSKMEAGRLELVEGAVSPHRLVADVVDMLRPQADDKQLALVGSLDAQVPAFVRGDELRLRQVLVNLLGNAVKYTDAGSVRVSVETEQHRADAYLLRFDVADTGVGIPADEIARLFEPFTQASTTASMRRPGTGLGLSIAQQLVELMGGEITLSSQVGRGSTFSFTLPTVATAPEAFPTPRPPAAPALARGRVLVVEDSPVNQALVERQLIRLGCEPVVASSGREALDLMAQLDLDLVLMDWQLPGMDGLETTRARRATEAVEGSRLPIVAMTASAMPDARAKCIAAGMDGFLAKPVKLEKLAQVLVDHLEPSAGVPAPVVVDGSVVDGSVLRTMAEEVGDPSIAARVVETYLGELDGRLAALRSSIGRDDRETLQRTAHTLKSTSRALGADALADVCAELEAKATDEQFDPTPLVEQLVDVASDAATILRDHLRDLVAG